MVTTSVESLRLPSTEWLVVRGPLLADGAEDVLGRLADIDGPRRLLLDLSHTTAIDHAGLSAVAGVHARLAAAGGALLLLPGERMRSAADLLRRVVGDDLVVVDRAAWGAEPGGWLSESRPFPPPDG